MQIDHLAVTCADLQAGADWVEAALGVQLQPGGQHALFSTHNRLLSLGPDMYLEVIAPDPAASPPKRPRWFDLDRASAPALTNWIVRTDDLAQRPPDAGEVLALARGDLSWEITVPANGALCKGGAYPSLIRWTGGQHPAPRLTERGVRLTRLEVHHPEPTRIAALLPAMSDDRLAFLAGPVALRAQFQTANGPKWLG